MVIAKRPPILFFLFFTPPHVQLLCFQKVKMATKERIKIARDSSFVMIVFIIIIIFIIFR